MSGNCYPGQLFLSARPMRYRIALRLPNKRGQLRARLSGLGSTRNRSRSATRDPTRRKPRRNARSKSKEFAARAATPYAKAAKVSPDGLCVEFLHGGALRRSVIEHGASCCLDALPKLGAGVLPVYRANDPRLLSSVSGGAADQASAAVLPCVQVCGAGPRERTPNEAIRCYRTPAISLGNCGMGLVALG
jgi:hypothetical protein